ncbi:MAG TPA: hypothetical protein VF121_16050 [Thermoanaerobaculia bacterium]|nr:hypothetical protein [Thermoanaerobaculia bacterium]
MKTLWKALAAVPFLGLVVWAIRSDVEEPRFAAAAAPLAAESAVPPPGSAAWRHAALWDDGKAEFCAYDVSWARYGHRYPGRALLILVKEPWAPDLEVKADEPRPDGFDVLKLNHVRDVPTGVYTYHQMGSVYFRRDSGAMRKIAATSSEACGVASADMVRGRLATRSYFDGQGDRSMPWPAGALPQDGLPAHLRDYVAGPAPASLQVFPSLLAGRFADLRPATYRLERQEQGEEVTLRLTAGDRFLAYTFDKAPPHRLRRFADQEGTTYRLAKCERIAYWEMHDPGGEAWLPPTVR